MKGLFLRLSQDLQPPRLTCETILAILDSAIAFVEDAYQQGSSYALAPHTFVVDLRFGAGLAAVRCRLRR
jgi:hypothetical protein